MSLQAAANEITKEIERLTKIRDSLLTDVTNPHISDATVAAPPAKRAAKKGAAKGAAKKTAKKASVVSTPVPAKKRVMSEATKKKISDAHKRRSAVAKRTA